MNTQSNKKVLRTSLIAGAGLSLMAGVALADPEPEPGNNWAMPHPASELWEISSERIQPSPTKFKFQAKISRAKLPVPEAEFEKIFVKLLAGTDELCTETLENVQVRNSVLNIDVGSQSNGCDFESIIAKTPRLSFRICIEDANNCLKPIELTSVPYSTKSTFSYLSETAHKASEAAQCHYAHRVTADTSLFVTKDQQQGGGVGYYDFHTPALADLGGLDFDAAGTLARTTDGFMQWTPLRATLDNQTEAPAQDPGGDGPPWRQWTGNGRLNICSRTADTVDTSNGVITDGTPQRLRQLLVHADETRVMGGLEVETVLGVGHVHGTPEVTGVTVPVTFFYDNVEIKGALARAWGNLEVEQNTIAKGNLTVGLDTTANGNLTVALDTTANGNLTVGLNTEAQGDLEVIGETRMGDVYGPSSLGNAAEITFHDKVVFLGDVGIEAGITTVITSEHIALDTIQDIDIHANAVGWSEMKDDAVGYAEMRHDAIGLNEMRGDAIGNAEMRDDAVDTLEIVDAAVTGDKLGVARSGSNVTYIGLPYTTWGYPNSTVTRERDWPADKVCFLASMQCAPTATEYCSCLRAGASTNTMTGLPNPPYKMRAEAGAMCQWVCFD